MSADALPPPQPDTCGLSRGSVGLSDAHREFIKMLAEIAVIQYLGETTPASTDAAQQLLRGEVRP